MLAFARCIRGHRFPSFPDPTNSGDMTHQMLANAGIDLQQPAVLHAGDACVSVTHGLITKAAVAHFVAGKWASIDAASTVRPVAKDPDRFAPERTPWSRALAGAAGWSGADWPVLNFKLAHREVLRVSGRQRHADGHGRRSDQTVRLRKRHARRRMIASPIAGPDPLEAADRRDAQPVEKAGRRNAFGIAQAAMNLLDADRRREWHVSMPAKRCESLDGSPAAPQQIDQHRGVEQDAHAYPTRRTSAVRCSRTHPAGSPSQSCSESASAPTAALMSFQRRSSSSARRTAAAMNVLR
jgi:hypothetical protein